VSAASVRGTRYRPAVRAASTLVVLLAALALAGCGGGDSDSEGSDTTPVGTVETTETVTTDSGTDIDGSYTGTNAICKAITNSSSALNIAASNGQFETVADEWEKIAQSAPADLADDVDTVVEGYRKIDEDPLGFGVMDTEPYKTAKANIDAWTAANCGQ
jgi:hypothetical protein